MTSEAEYHATREQTDRLLAAIPKWETTGRRIENKDLDLYGSVSNIGPGWSAYLWHKMQQIGLPSTYPTQREAEAAIEQFMAGWCSDCRVSQVQIVDALGRDDRCGNCGAEL